MSNRLPRSFLALLLLLPAPAVRADSAPLAEKLEAVMRGPDYKHARWGVLVVEAESGKTVYEHNAEQLFAPASVTKLYSCAAAQVALGGEHRFETPVYRRGTLKDGRLEGDLILVAKGDLTLGGRTDARGQMAFTNDDHIYAGPTKTTTRLTDTDPLAGLKELARQVKAGGVRELAGDVLIDARLFEPARGSGSGPGVVTPVLVNDNVVDVIVSPGVKPGLPATYDFRPATAFVQVDVQVETAPEDGRTRITVQRVGPQRYSVRGRVAAGAPPQVRICPIDDPAGFARALFIEALRREGVAVRASALKPPSAELPEAGSYGKLTRVAAFRSPPLSEVLKVTLKVSHNLYASTLPLLLAVKHGKRTQAEGMRLQGKVLSELGVDVGAISLESGAGGGNGDKVSPRETVKLLLAMRKRPDWPAFEAALPVLGVDGSLATAVKKGSKAAGKVKGKTGTYTDDNLLQGRSHLRSKTLAGVMTTAKGTQLVYALFVNDVPLPRGVTSVREGRVLGRLCEIIYELGP
jgi:D-alanyl-D-alanine carboxypeptidase/D-alanyl-D-alanine-endopeptidase (penicillin-binding protein 4)